MVTIIFHMTDWEQFPGSDNPRSQMNNWCQNIKAFGVNKLVMIDKTEFKLGQYYKHDDLDLIFERYDSISDYFINYPIETNNYVFLELKTFINNFDYINYPLSTYNHPENAIYVVGPDFSSIEPLDESSGDWVYIDTPNNMALYAHAAIMITLYDRSLKINN